MDQEALVSQFPAATADAPPPPPAANASPTTAVPPPSHPSYAEMITAAILWGSSQGKEGGSSKRAIAKYIDRVYTDLPPSHSALLTHHLKRLKNSGHLVMIKNSYQLSSAVPIPPPSPRSAAPPPLAVSPAPPSAVAAAGSSPPPANPSARRGPGRPPKQKPATATSTQPTPVSSNPVVDNGSGFGSESGKKRRGRPPKQQQLQQGDVATEVPFVQPISEIPPKLVNGEATSVGQKKRGRPPKQSQVLAAPPVVPFAQPVVQLSEEVVTADVPKRRPGRPPKANVVGSETPAVNLVGSDMSTGGVTIARSRGRPRKDALGPVSRPVGKKPRGRPRKLGGPVGMRMGMIEGKRRGRPPKGIGGFGPPKVRRRTGRPVGRPRKMSERDGQPTRRARGRGRERNRQQSQFDDMQEVQPFGSPVRIPPGRASTSSYTPTPPYDPRWTLPSSDQHIFPGGDPYTTFSTPHLGEQSVAGSPEVPFFQTYGTYMPFNQNLVLSLPRAGQQPCTSQQQSQPVDEPITGPIVRSQRHSSQPPHSQPNKPPTENTPTEGRSQRRGQQNVVFTTSKILLEPEGDTFKPYVGVPNRIGEIIKGKFPGAWPAWGDVPLEQRDFWFNEFKKYFYWRPEHDCQIRRNFEIRGAKQLKNMFCYARKKGKMPNFISPDNLEKLKKYWESEDFKKRSATGKTNRRSDVDGVGPSLHTCGAIPMTEWRRRFSVSLEREPTIDKLYKATHQHRHKDKTGSWVCQRSEKELAEHLKRWKEYRNSQQGTTETSQGMPLSETDIWVQANLNNKGRVYGFGAEGVVMKQRARHSFSTTRSSSVNNYDPREMAQRFNESVQKAAEEARSQLRQELEVDLTAKLRAQLNDEWNQREATLKKSLDKEKVAMKKTVSTAVQKATKKLWKFFSTQVAGSSSKPPPQLDLDDDDDGDEDEDEDEDDDDTQM